jgi:hypothetical protein
MFAKLRLKLLEKVISSLLQFGWYLYLDCVVERGRFALVVLPKILDAAKPLATFITCRTGYEL